MLLWTLRADLRNKRDEGPRPGNEAQQHTNCVPRHPCPRETSCSGTATSSKGRYLGHMNVGQNKELIAGRMPKEGERRRTVVLQDITFPKCAWILCLRHSSFVSVTCSWQACLRSQVLHKQIHTQDKLDLDCYACIHMPLKDK